ncbi:tyrosine-type recombinase/integrase [Streptomyces sp. OF3]|uniref:Tyrosine-type recombinase/integrase n=1 Tax=Streptomyces alkaliterrae TaxID=2213162 RepID=A0A7W3ZM18_9ACTN|nr:tyrosine-type recombinase/integrase [Streptomyces alkaliterrae]MBB1253060.1 tyrosine-type recombinase/integrase [Streptomyces alkaliterrae]
MLSPIELDRLITSPHIPAAHRALWAIMMGSDVRLAEALSLDVRDIDYAGRAATVEYRKRACEPTTVPLDARAVEFARAAAAGRTEGPLLIAADGRPLTREQAIRTARQHGGVSIHAFRTAGQALRAQRAAG